VNEPDFLAVREKAIEVLSAYAGAEDMITIGAYADGSDPKIDHAKKIVPSLNQFLRQDIQTRKNFSECAGELNRILNS